MVYSSHSSAIHRVDIGLMPSPITRIMKPHQLIKFYQKKVNILKQNYTNNNKINDLQRMFTAIILFHKTIAYLLKFIFLNGFNLFKPEFNK